MAADDTSIENDNLRLEIRAATGCIKSLYDKREQFEWLRREAAIPLVLAYTSDTWSHGVLRYDDVVGQFAPVSVRLVECGPVKSVIRVESQYERSRLVQDFAMYPDLDRIDVHVTVDRHEQFKLLKLNFTLNLYFSTVTYAIPYGAIVRPANGEEESGQTWVDLTGVGRNHCKIMGMSILNDGKYSFDAKEHEINVTVLRSPIYAHHYPHEPRPDRHYTFIDQGMQHFTYTLLPHRGEWQRAGTVRRAAGLNQRPIAQLESIHGGALPSSDSYLSVDAESVAVTVVKRAEDCNDLIVRCLEKSGAATSAVIRLPYWNRVIEADFRPGEIKSFRAPGDGKIPVVETNFIEWDE